MYKYYLLSMEIFSNRCSHSAKEITFLQSVFIWFFPYKKKMESEDTFNVVALYLHAQFICWLYC